jgi:hypothetical protein
MEKMDNEMLPLGKILSAWRTLYVARYEAYTARTFCRHGLSKVGLLKRHSIFPISSLVVPVAPTQPSKFGYAPSFILSTSELHFSRTFYPGLFFLILFLDLDVSL